MGDGISFRVVTAPFTDWAKDREKRMNRAAMFAVRDAGRIARRVGRTAAPVLKDSTLESHRQIQKRIRSGDESGKAAYSGGKAIPGLLKASIASSKNLKFEGVGSYSLKVGPRGQRVHLYAGKAEKNHQFMAAAEEAAKAELERIAKEAFERVWR